MADETNISEAAVVETTNTTNDVSSMLQGVAWGEENTAPTQVETAPTEVKVEATAPVEVKDENKIDNLQWVKEKLGYENVEETIKGFNELKAKAEKSFDWKDDKSKLIAESINEGKYEELYNYLHSKNQIEKLSKAEINKDTASELVMFGLQKDNPNLSGDDILFLFNEKYGIPQQPIQGIAELDEDYEARVKSWETQSQHIERKLLIEAKMQQPKLAEYNSKLEFPTIQRNDAPQQQVLTQEDIARLNSMRDNFIQSATQAINDFNGFNVQVKDKDVDYSVAYTPSQEEKSFINSKIQKFAQSGFDANTIFAEDWVEADGKTLNVKRMTEDLSRIYFGNKSDSKLAVDSANKRLEAFLAEKKNIEIGKTTQQQVFNPSNIQNTMDALRQQAFA